MDEWISCATHWINTQPQCSSRWFTLHLARATGSLISALIGHNHFQSPEEAIAALKGHPRKEPAPANKILMEEGVRLEPEAREWYSRTRGVKVGQIGMAIPK